MPTDNSPLTQPATPVSEEPCCKISHKTSVIIVISVISALLVASAVYAVYYFSQSQSLNPSATKNVVTPSKNTNASPSATIDPTAGWKTYIGNNYEFKYPANWSYTGGDDSVAIFDKEFSNLTKNDVYGVIDISPAGGNDSGTKKDQLQLKITDYNGAKITHGNYFVEEKLANVTVSGIDSFKLRLSNLNDPYNSISPGLLVSVPYKSEDIILRSFYGVGKISDTALDQYFDLIISTFKFLNSGTGTSGDTNVWKAYNYKELSIEIPPNWGIVEVPTPNNTSYVKMRAAPKLTTQPVAGFNGLTFVYSTGIAPKTFDQFKTYAAMLNGPDVLCNELTISGIPVFQMLNDSGATPVAATDIAVNKNLIQLDYNLTDAQNHLLLDDYNKIISTIKFNI